MSWLFRRKMIPLSHSADAVISHGPFAAAPIRLPSSPRETHFWYVVPEEVKDASLLSNYMEILSPNEKKYVLSIREEKLRKSAIITRALVRTTLARYTGSKVSPRSLEFRKNKFGKPEVTWQNHEGWDLPNLHFNVSHTSSLIACAVALGVQIGVDIEEKDRKLLNNILSFVRRYFSPSEVEFLCSISEPETQRLEFFKLWTLKEAYVKALGRGFSAIPFRDFAIRFDAETGVEASRYSAPNVRVEAIDDSGNVTTNCQFGLFELEGSHYAAVCLALDGINAGSACNSIRLKAWRTLPLVEDECVTETDAVVTIRGLSKVVLARNSFAKQKLTDKDCQTIHRYSWRHEIGSSVHDAVGTYQAPSLE